MDNALEEKLRLAFRAGISYVYNPTSDVYIDEENKYIESLKDEEYKYIESIKDEYMDFTSQYLLHELSQYNFKEVTGLDMFDDEIEVNTLFSIKKSKALEYKLI